MKKIFILCIMFTLNASAITIDTSEINQGQQIKSSTLSSIFSAIENAINNLISKQEKTEIWAGHMNNRTSLIGTNGGVVFLDQVENSNSDVFSYNNGEITIHKAGVITITYNQDIQHACSYATSILEKNSSVISYSLNYSTGGNGYWDGLSNGTSTGVSAMDKIRVKLSCSNGNIDNLDNGAWGRVAIKWHGVL